MTNASFTSNSITINGSTFPAEYSITPSGKVFAFVELPENGEAKGLRIRFDTTDEHYPEALDAAQQQRAERNPAPTMISVLEDELAMCFRPIEPAADEPEADPADAAPDAADEPTAETNAAEPVEAEKPVAPKKLFVGLEITGKGWKIVADGAYDRTRVIFKKMPSEAARKAVKEAGFFWSPTMKSWNKKLTNKAWRAAQELAMQLRTIAV